MRVAVNLSGTVLRNAKRRASERGVTLSVLLEDALRAYLPLERSASAPAIQLHTVRGKLVQPNLDLDRTSALVAMDDEADFARMHNG